MQDSNRIELNDTIGIDLGDKISHLALIDGSGDVAEHAQLRTTRKAFRKRFEGMQPTRVVLETGGHSNWVAELLDDLGHEVIVANARKLKAISSSDCKTDRRDCELLARLGRVDRSLLAPIDPRSREARLGLALLRARTALVEGRTRLINHTRGVAKSFGHRITGPSSSTTFVEKAKEQLPEELVPILEPLLLSLQRFTDSIKAYDKQIRIACEQQWPVTRALTQVSGVGFQTALYFVLTIGNPLRFANGRKIGAFVGLAPRKDQSGERDPELRITKSGDPELRRLLVQCAQHILGYRGQDSDLRRYGERIQATGAQKAKRRAVVAVARKLAVLLRALWITGEVYEPLRNSQSNAATS